MKSLNPNQKIILGSLLQNIGITKTQIPKIVDSDKNIIELMELKGSDIELIKPLLRIFNPNIQGKDGNTALILASMYGKKNIVQLLLQNGSDPNIKNSVGHTALILASRMGHKDIVQLLLQYSVDPNIKDTGGNTALKWAEDRGHTEIAAMLRRAME